MKSINIVYVKKSYDNLMKINFMLAKQADVAEGRGWYFFWENDYFDCNTNSIAAQSAGCLSELTLEARYTGCGASTPENRAEPRSNIMMDVDDVWCRTLCGIPGGAATDQERRVDEAAD
ncbi:uncharacterized protein LOC119765364 [Culex quinquefasciatus]|uniref:uncharacterized protein LOC119765364 n=1 Tax=Culex quinquefasciatus TaxID=7176 RepID=UPI0018E3F918|nr:uncharacterized protein LOC119765364 [Culex quinquefasciatus]